MCTVSFKHFFFACSCVSSAVAMYSSELRQELRTQMFITEVVQIRKCWTLKFIINYILAITNILLECFPKNSLNRGFPYEQIFPIPWH